MQSTAPLKKRIALASLIIITVALAGSTSIAWADPLYKLRKDGSNIPIILYANTSKGQGGYTGITAAGQITTTSDGKLVVHDSAFSANAYIVIDLALPSANNAPVNAGVGRAALWNNAGDLWIASTAATFPTKTNLGSGGSSKGMSRATPNNTMFAWEGGGIPRFNEIQFQDGGGNFNTTSNMAAALWDQSISIDSGSHKRGIDWVSETSSGSNVFNMLGGLDSNAGVRKFQLGALTGLDTGSNPPVSGTRTLTSGGRLIGGGSNTAASLIADLVPGIGDTMRGFRYSPTDSRLYFVSDGGSQVYLSAVTFDYGTNASDSVATYVDLDPDSANNYLTLTYDSGDAFPDLLSTGGIAMDSAGTLYISNGGSRIFIVDPTTPVPEPGALALMGLGGFALLAMIRRRVRARVQIR